MEAIINAHKWTFDTIIRAEPVLYTTEISHDQLTRRRHQDPGDWVMNNIMDGLGATEAKTLSPDFDPSFFLPDDQEAKPRRQPSLALAYAKRFCAASANARSTTPSTSAGLAGRKPTSGHAASGTPCASTTTVPLAPWQDGIHLYDAICGTIMAESAGNPFAYNRNVSGWLPGGKRGPSADRGLVQINDRAWPDISDAEAYDPAFAINFIVKHFPSKPHWWHGFKAWKARR